MLFFTEPDRLLHTFCSFLGAGILFFLFKYLLDMNFYKAVILAVYAINILGVAYETFQVINGTYTSLSLKDMFYNGLGSAALVFVLMLTHYNQLLLPDPMLTVK